LLGEELDLPELMNLLNLLKPIIVPMRMKQRILRERSHSNTLVVMGKEMLEEQVVTPEFGNTKASSVHFHF
jgi:hypothetical protein